MPAPRVRRGQQPPTKPEPSSDINAAVVKLLDAITVLVEVVTTEMQREDR